MTPIFPGQGRVPYTPLRKKEPAYSGPIVVARDEGIVEEQPYGRSIKLLCNETVGDETFTLAERTYEPGRESQVVEKHDSEAVHILEGQGIYAAWPANVSDDRPITAPLQPGMEIITGQFVKHRIRNTGDSPLVAVVTECHADFPAYPHNYPAIFQPGKGTDIHQHDNRVEAFYVVQGPGAVIIADPDNTTTRELMVPERGAAYQPMYVYHRQFNPEPDGEPCYLIHSMVVYTHRGSRMPQVHIRQHELDGKTPLWEADSHL
jgi:oxalate decarboxylase/phosphoglucose isomerase-like protein (cupin superfamily)